MHKATCHAVVIALVDAGLVQRHEAKTYSLGSRLIELGRAASDRLPGMVQARREMHGIAIQLGLGSMVAAAEDDRLFVVDRTADAAPYGLPVELGIRRVLEPPMGTVFLAWSPPEFVEAWLTRSTQDSTPEQIDSYRETLVAVRARGYAVGLEVLARDRVAELVDRMATATEEQERLAIASEVMSVFRDERYLPVRLDPAESERVNLVSAPIFDSSARPVLALYVVGTPERPLGGVLEEAVEALLAAAHRATATIGGRPPAT